MLFKGCSFTVTKPENEGARQLLCILCVLDLNYSLCPWITILAITPGGLWKHCSSWRAFFMIQGQTQRQNSHCPCPKLQNNRVEAVLNTFIQSCKFYALSCLMICTVAAKVFFLYKKCSFESSGWFTPNTFQIIFRTGRGIIQEML